MTGCARTVELGVLCALGFVAGTARSEVLFRDDFESAPEVSTLAPIPAPPGVIPADVDADPVAQIGTWRMLDKASMGVGSLSEQVTNYIAAGPPAVGPHGGNNYLRMQHYQDTEAFATFSSPQTVDVRLDTWVYVPYVSFRVFMQDSAGNNGNLLSWGEGAPGFLSNHNGGFQATAIPYTLDTWQHLIIDFHIGSATYDVSLDGITETGIPMAFGPSGGFLSDYNQILFAGGGYPSAYLDDVLVEIPVAQSQWGLDGDGNWSTAANWTGGVPNAAGADALFGGIITAARTVTLDAPQIVGALSFDNANSYTLAGTSTLTIDVSSGSGSIKVLNGSHSIAAPIVLVDDTTVDVAAGQTLSVQHLRGAGITVNSGTLKMIAGASANSADGTSKLTAVTVASGAVLDLTNNSLVIDYTGTSVQDDVRQALADGRLTTSMADANKKLGYGEASATGFANGTFAGQSVDADAVLVKFTYGGDSNLDGKVDVGDLGNLASNWQQSAPWTGGDFDYNGTVNVGDLGILATNWQQGVTNPPPLGPRLADALVALGLPDVSVPEPGAAGVAGLFVVGLLTRRRRHS